MGKLLSQQRKKSPEIMHTKAQQDSSVLEKNLTLWSWCTLGHWQSMHFSVYKSLSKEHLPEFIDTKEQKRSLLCVDKSFVMQEILMGHRLYNELFNSKIINMNPTI